MTPGLFILAIAPVVAIIWYIYHKDKYEHEPWSFLIFAFICGLLSALAAPFITGHLPSLPEQYLNQPLDLVYNAYFLSSFIEETLKFLFLRYLIYYRKVFNEPMDGIVYGVMIGMGFATLENLYFVVDGGWQTAVLRIFTAVPAHAIFGVVMGYYVGKAKYISHRNVEYTLKGLLVPIVLHGTYNVLLLQERMPYLSLAAILGLVVSIRYVRKMIKEQQDASPFKK